jgi:hypothetical protein
LTNDGKTRRKTNIRPAGPHEGEREQQKLGIETFCIQKVWPSTLYGLIFGANFFAKQAGG